ncbi:MAG: CDP-diacylglycerol--glycerol-3-phosphate 3-phosphatidyltransferase [Verrucomicrobiota bacterium]
MNLPNTLTLIRLGLTALLVTSLTLDYSGHVSVALIIFLIATGTDYLDGVIARKWNLITDFGKLMDPLADKVLTASVFICLIPFGVLPAWVVIIIISREFLITGLRLLASSKNIILPAEKLGKHKTAWQMATIIYFLLLLAIPEWNERPLSPAVWNFGQWLVGITVILTVYSGLAYLYKNRALISAA